MGVPQSNRARNAGSATFAVVQCASQPDVQQQAGHAQSPQHLEASLSNESFSPRTGILRICIREGLVPPVDAAEGVVLGVRFEDEMLWTKAAYKPQYVEESGRSEAQKWIRNLCARFDKASVSKCLGMKPDKIQEVLDMSIPEVREQGDLLQQEPVIWDHALHFLVRNPHTDISATVVYKGKSAKVEHAVAIFSGKKLSAAKKAAQRLAKKKLPEGDALACDASLAEATWTLDLDSKSTADIFVEVSLTPLEAFY